MASGKVEPDNGLGFLMCGWNGCDTYFQTAAPLVDPDTQEPVLDPDTGAPVVFWDCDADSRDIWAHAEDKHPEMFV